MLEAIRNRSASFIVKALFILLILSFVAWGAGDYITGGSGPGTVATAGDQEISSFDVQRSFRRQLQQLQQAMPGIDAQQARQLGILQAVVVDLVQKGLIRQTALDLGLTVSDDVIVREIRTDPSFFDSFGKFSQERFQQVVRSANLTEQAFVQLIREEVSRQLLLDSLGRGVEVATPLVEAAYRYKFEQRKIELVRIPQSAVADVGSPDAAELQEYYESNSQNFTKPEYRGATYLLLHADDLVPDISVTDQELQEAFDVRAAEFAGRSTRTLQQMILSDQAKAEQAHQRLSEGADFVQVAKDVAGLEQSALELGTVQRADLPLEELVDPAFALQTGEFSPPIQTALGWHILKATAAEDAVAPAFADVKDQLAEVVAKERALDEMFEIANRLEDSLAGGATLEDASQALGLPIKTVAPLDATGRKQDGTPAEGLPSGASFLNTVFDTEEGLQSPLTEAGDDAYFVLRIDSVVQPTVPPLAEIEADVIGAWKRDAEAVAAETAAGKLAEAARAGGTLKALADAKSGFAYSEPEAFTRDRAAAPKGVPAAVITQVFDAKKGDVVVAKAGDAALVAKVIEVIAADPASDAEAMASLRDQLRTDVQQDLTVQLLNGLEARHGTTINQAALAQVN